MKKLTVKILAAGILLGAGMIAADSADWPGIDFPGIKVMAAESPAGEAPEMKEAAAESPAGEDSEMKEAAAESPAGEAPDTNRRDSLCGTCYEVFVYSFFDGNGDGIGDLPGLTQKLDYINNGNAADDEDLGCDMIWVMPVFPSPTYHKYDVTDYCAIDPVYGTMEDFETLLNECHKRGVRLILDLPLNHTSTEHPWFKEAADYLRSLGDGQDPDPAACHYTGYYHFSREPQDGYAPLPDSGWYYEARFWEGMPDLALDEPEVREEIEKILTFWMEKGVDGFRLDAVTYYFTENEESNIDFLAWLNEKVKKLNPSAYLVGEAWASQAVYARYYASGIDSLFNFEFAGAEGLIARFARGKKAASSYGEKIVEQEELFSSFHPDYIDAPFYTNHDMARGAGYYTRDDGTRVKLGLGLNLMMPGNAFLYYGEELGMKGSGRDENKRAPMFWNTDPASEGMTAGPPEMEDFDMKFPALEEQAEDPYSIYSYVRKAVHLREDLPVIASGKTLLAEGLSGKEVCVLVRTEENAQPVVLVINMSEENVTFDRKAVNEALSDTLAGLGEKRLTMAGHLLMPGSMPVFSARRLTVPAFGILVLSVEGD